MYDQTFFLPPGDPAVTQAFADAASALSTFLQPQLFSLGAPQLIASSSVLGPSMFLGAQFTGATQTVTIEDTIGPGPIIVGDRDLGGVPFDVLAGTNNLNVNTHTENFYDDLFQATRTDFATYQITAEVTAPPVPEPATFALVGGALAAGVARRRLRTRRGGAGR